MEGRSPTEEEELGQGRQHTRPQRIVSKEVAWDTGRTGGSIRQRMGEAAGQPRQVSAASRTETQEERTTCVWRFPANLLRCLRQIAAARITTTQRAEYAIKIQGF